MLNLLMCIRGQGISLGKNTVGQPLWLPHWIRQAPLGKAQSWGQADRLSHHWVTERKGNWSHTLEEWVV